MPNPDKKRGHSELDEDNITSGKRQKTQQHENFEGMCNEDEEDGIPYKGKQIRATWLPGIYAILKTFSESRTENKAVVCGICEQDINIDVFGEEVYDEDLHYKNSSRPHIDHYNLVWSARLTSIETRAKKGNWDVEQYKNEIRKVFNSPGLQLAHKRCNLVKGDKKGVSSGFYDKCRGDIGLHVTKKLGE
jgi:hypothetical protein